MPVYRLASEMPARELALWLEWDQVKPPDPDDVRAARICLTVGLAMTGDRSLKLDDFLPRRRAVEMECEQMMANFAAATAHLKHGGA